MSAAIEQIGSLTEVIEKLTRPGLGGVAGKTVEKRCARDLTAYFVELKKAVLKLGLEKAVTSGATAELARHAAMIRLNTVVHRERTLLEAVLASNMAAAMLVADKVTMLNEATQTFDPSGSSIPFFGDGIDVDQATDQDNAVTADQIAQQIDKLGLSGEAAAAWAQKHAAELVVGLDQTTVDQIADAVHDGITQQLGVEGTAKLIKEVLDEMSTSRAQLIAATEMNAAMSEAALQKMTRIGIQYKQWITDPLNCCDECAANEEEGAIPVDEEFPSGDMRPPVHPRCRCAITGARAPK